ncbi:MAG TPA: protein kinase [Gemmatimonadales bacterium]|nr:protein kinase [Gemmatimonadales bacterium]
MIERLTTALEDRYRIEREIGQGGMATVYLARDLKHERQVALKVLHPELGAVLGADRFLGEIKTTATLQHPNILQLFDSGAADGLLYYVMPFVDGETLRSRLSREKQLPLDDAVAIARGAAAALDYAHRHGVIHRDIKPENILLQDGQPLVADFGIALAVKQAGGARLTQTGLSLGTPQYMSPEQATGERELDVRSDVYALGAVTYEMLAGEPPFTGSTTQAIIAKLMTEEPRPLAALRRTVPPHVEAAVHQALEKLPADRFGSAAEFSAALGGRRTGSAADTRTVGVGTAAVTSRISVTRLLAFGLPLMLVGALGGLLIGRRIGVPPTSAVPSRLAIMTPDAGVAGQARWLDLSPDGETVAYVSGGDRNQIMLRRLDAAAPVALAGAEFSTDPRFSPDGRWVYLAPNSGSMRRIPVGGGSPTEVPGLPNASHTSWQADGTAWINPFSSLGTLNRLAPGSATPEPRFPQDSVGRRLLIQQILPGDREALVVRYPTSGNSGEAMVLDLGSGRLAPILDQRVTEVRYTMGHLVYVLPDNSMNAVAFDLRRRAIGGEPVRLADDVAQTVYIAQFAVAANGTVAYIPAQASALALVSRAGEMTPVSDARWNFHSPRFSPDGRRIAIDFTAADGRDVWVFDRDQGTLTRVTFDKDGHDPEWNRDGSINYSSSRSGQVGVYRVRPGGGASDSVFASATLGWTGEWLPDGSGVVTVLSDLTPGSGNDVALVRPGQSGSPVPMVGTPFNDAWPALSPDGKWLAFSSDQSGRTEVYVQPVAGGGGRVQISLDGGNEPVWAPGGRELFYRRPAGAQVELRAATLQLGPEIRVIQRSTLFKAGEFDAAQPHSNYDITPDGRTFVMVRRNPSSYIVVFQNLPELVRRLQGATTR